MNRILRKRLIRRGLIVVYSGCYDRSFLGRAGITQW
jgi:hypothetical protein